MNRLNFVVIFFTLVGSTAMAQNCEDRLHAVRCRGVGCLAASINSANSGRLPDLPGELIAGAERFTFDNDSFKEINGSGGIQGGLLEPLLKEIQTPLGKERAKWELENPLLDDTLIRARQVAVRNLVDNPKQLAALNRLFKKHKEDGESQYETHVPNDDGKIKTVVNRQVRSLYQNPLEALTRLEDPRNWNGVTGDAYVLLQDLLAVVAPLSVIYDSNGGVTFSSLVGHMLMYFGREGLNQSGFEEASHLSEIFERNNRKVVDLLKQSLDPVLWQIGHTLDRANDPSREDSFYQARRRMNRARFIHHSLFIPGYLKMTRATRGLSSFLEAIIEYLDALSELELITGLANYQLKNPSYHLLEVKPGVAGSIKLTEAHNPHFLLRQNETGIPSRPNQFQFTPERRVELVTGANAMGKSSGLRTENILSLATLIGLPVPAKGELSPMVMIAGNKVADTLGKSLMMAQCERVAQMLSAAQALAAKGLRVMLKFDEPFDGTSPEERRALVAAIIIFIGGQPNLYASIATHERSLIDLVSGVEAANRLRVPTGDTSPASLMSQYSEALRGVRNVHYANYEKVEGGATTRNALVIAAKMGMPEAVVAIAQDILDSSGVVSE